MLYVEVRCPSCSKMGKIEISEDLMKNISRGLIAVNVAADSICPHSFNAYIDKNLIVRDYFIPDFQIQIPETELEEAIRNKKIPGIDLIDLDLIKLNLIPIVLASILRAVFFKRKFVIIINHKFLQNHILNFFEYITQNSFKAYITILSKDVYSRNIENYKDYIIFEGKNIINDIDKILEPKTLKFENKIIKQFIGGSKSTLSLALLKNEIKSTFIMARGVSDFIKGYENKEKLGTKAITDYLKDFYGFKIQKDYKNYINWLLKIANEYFTTTLSERSNVEDFLEFI